jgi:hypothetical protein
MDPRTEMVMEGLSRSLMKKFMHNFMTALREYPGDSDELKRFVHIFIEENRQPEDGGGRQPVVETPNPLPEGASHPTGVDMEQKGVEQDVPECTHEKA